MRIESPGRRAPKYRVDDVTEGQPDSEVIASDADGQDASVSVAPTVPRCTATSARRSATGNPVANGGDFKTATIQQSSSHPQSVINSPQPAQRALSLSKQPAEGLQKPALLDLQHEYGIIREHVNRKDVDIGLPALASIAALRDCMADLKDAAKMYSEAWFLMVRENIKEGLVRAGFAGLATT